MFLLGFNLSNYMFSFFKKQEPFRGRNRKTAEMVIKNKETS